MHFKSLHFHSFISFHFFHSFQIHFDFVAKIANAVCHFRCLHIILRSSVRNSGRSPLRRRWICVPRSQQPPPGTLRVNKRERVDTQAHRATTTLYDALHRTAPRRPRTASRKPGRLLASSLDTVATLHCFALR